MPSPLLTRVRDYATPPTPLAGRLARQSLLFATGEGSFLTGSAVFFLVVVGLSPAEVGIGLTLAGITSLLVAVPTGKVVDRFGPKRMWALSALLQASLFTLWPFIDGFAGYAAMLVVMELANTLGGSAHGAYTIDVLPPAERVTSRAYMYSALNIGFTVGAGLGGLALAFDSNAVLAALPWFTALVFVVNAAAIQRLPRAPHDERSPEERRVVPPGPGPLRNPGWLASEFLGGVMWTNQVLLHVVIPLWLVARTDAPEVLLAFLFGTNTVMCIVLPLAASRGVRDVTTALRALRVSAVFFVLACAITLATHETVGWLTIALIWLGHVAVTGAELYLSAASWSFEAELMDPRRRGDYQGAGELFGTLGRVWAPALYTWLALEQGALGWTVIAAIIVAATVAAHPAARSAERFLDRHVPPAEREGAGAVPPPPPPVTDPVAPGRPG